MKLSFLLPISVLAVSEVPFGISREIYCETCHIMADVLVDKLDELDEQELDWDEEVILILDVLCGKRNFRDHAATLGYPTDKMVRACQGFHNKHDDKLEEALVKNFSDGHEMATWLCHEVSFISKLIFIRLNVIQSS